MSANNITGVIKRGAKIESKSLDITPETTLENKPEENFYFKAEGGNKVFSLTKSQASKSKLLESLMLNPDDKSTEESPLVLKNITQESDILNGFTYSINTEEMLNYVYKYLVLWKDNLKQENYCKEEPVQTGNPSQVLQCIDVEFIKSS